MRWPPGKEKAVDGQMNIFDFLGRERELRAQELPRHIGESVHYYRTAPTHCGTKTICDEEIMIEAASETTKPGWISARLRRPGRITEVVFRSAGRTHLYIGRQ